MTFITLLQYLCEIWKWWEKSACERASSYGVEAAPCNVKVSLWNMHEVRCLILDIYCVSRFSKWLMVIISPQEFPSQKHLMKVCKGYWAALLWKPDWLPRSWHLKAAGIYSHYPLWHLRQHRSKSCSWLFHVLPVAEAQSYTCKCKYMTASQLEQWLVFTEAAILFL